jgi:hypothetical protein
MRQRQAERYTCPQRLEPACGDINFCPHAVPPGVFRRGHVDVRQPDDAAQPPTSVIAQKPLYGLMSFASLGSSRPVSRARSADVLRFEFQSTTTW